MNDYVLTCCSTADLSKEYFEKRNLGIVYFHFELDGVSYLDDCGQSISSEELFHRMDQGATTKTSQIAIGEYCDFWEPYLKDGKDILHVTLSSGISGTYQSAVIAADELKVRYPERRIYVVDSLGASSGYGLLMDLLADRRDAGAGLEELWQWAEDNKLRLHHWFYSTDLTYYIRGGRISKASGMVGSLLNICPLLNMDAEGRLIPREKIRGKKNVMKRALEKMIEHAENGRNYTGKCFLCHSLFLDEAMKLAAMIEETFPKMDGKVQIFPIGATIGSHTGPGTISIFFMGDKRE